MVHDEEFLETEDEMKENTYYFKKTVPGRVEPIWVSVEASGKVLKWNLTQGRWCLCYRKRHIREHGEDRSLLR